MEVGFGRGRLQREKQVKLTCLCGTSQKGILKRPDNGRENTEDARLHGHQRKTSPLSIKAKAGYPVAWLMNSYNG